MEENRMVKFSQENWDILFEDDRNNAVRTYKFGMIENSKVLYYTSKTIFPFGRHKMNPLSYVYKCDPSYIEWCMLNANGFILSTETIKILSTENVFSAKALNILIKGSGENTITLDLSFCMLNDKGFPYHEKVEEVKPFIFSNQAIQKNISKLKMANDNGQDPSIVFKGSDWQPRGYTTLLGNSNMKVHIITKK